MDLTAGADGFMLAMLELQMIDSSFDPARQWLFPSPLTTLR
jgi:hypothetical protein